MSVHREEVSVETEVAVLGLEVVQQAEHNRLTDVSGELEVEHELVLLGAEFQRERLALYLGEVKFVDREFCQHSVKGARNMRQGNRHCDSVRAVVDLGLL